MSWLTGQRGACTYICPEDRYVTKSMVDTCYAPYDEPAPRRLEIQNSFVCPICRKKLINMGAKWRAPKKRNDKAWRAIIDGNIWWDHKAIDSKVNKARNKWQPWSGKRSRPAYYNTQSSTARRELYSIEYNNSHITDWFNKQMSERS